MEPWLWATTVFGPPTPVEASASRSSKSSSRSWSTAQVEYGRTANGWKVRGQNARTSHSEPTRRRAEAAPQERSRLTNMTVNSP